jgi:hypothetical protein
MKKLSYRQYNTGRRRKNMKLESIKRLIGGTVYSIEEAELIAVGTNLAIPEDEEVTLDILRYYAETKGEFVAEMLYRTTDGEYFVYGMGGNKSEYLTAYVSGTGAGSDIWLVDESEVVSFFEHYNLVDEYERFLEGRKQ